MADPSAYVIASWLSVEVSSTDFRPLLDCAIETLDGHWPGKSIEEQAEYAEQILPQIVGALDKKKDESNEDGIAPSFELSTDGGTPYLRAVRTIVDATLDRLLEMDPDQFEVLCGKVLTAMGCRADVRGKTGDGGVDFVGHDLPLYVNATRGARVLVVGQAKRYKKGNLVDVTELRHFVGGAVHLTSDPLESMFRRQILAPVMYAFWTTSNFHPSARKYARDVGLWYLSGLALAQLVDRLGVVVG
jgi:restriction endonuclease Mrr